MTGTEPEVAPSTVQPVAELFTAAASVLWATTYNLDLSLFNEFLLGRLGDPPLNVAILADHRRLAVSLDRIPSERTDTLASVNRRWLLRAVRPGNQAFHPKTYLVVTSGRTTLLVGSGNLSTAGLDEGREVFTTFRSGTPVGDAAIGSWRAWMRRLVEQIDDVTLAQRFRDLESRLPAPQTLGLAAPSPLLHNLDTPISAQLASALGDAATGGVDELHLAAPFYDDEAGAVGRLLDLLEPRRVRIFVTGSTSVNGARLAERLRASGAQVEVSAYEPDRFVHAKLVGIVKGRRGWLLSGSANLSLAALVNTVGHGANVELAVLATLDPEVVRSLFLPPEMSTVARTLDSLVDLSFRSAAEPELPGVRLRTAAALADGCVEVVCESPCQPDWLLDDLASPQPLIIEPSGRVVTRAPLPGRLVRLTDAAGTVLSNRVVVDDPASLANALNAGSGRPAADRPVELAPGDLETPLGQALEWLHRNLVMDVSEQPNNSITGGVGAEEAEQQADDNLWERLAREQLGRDPRANTYHRMFGRKVSTGTEPIIELLEKLRAQAPSQPAALSGGSLLARLLTGARKPGPVHQWKPSTRIRIRARNVLRRWASAQTDPRLVWVDPLAPAGNFAMIAGTLAHLNLERARHPEHVELTPDDLDDLWLRWLQPFVGTGQGDGWLEQLHPDDLALAQQRLPEWLPEAVAALCWLSVRPGPLQRERIVASQAMLAAAYQCDLLEPTPVAAAYLSAVIDNRLTRAQLDTQLFDAITFIDDDLWCAQTRAALSLQRLELLAPPGAAAIQVRLDVRGIDDPLLDARVPRLVAAVRRYRRCSGVAVYCADAWRMVFVDGHHIGYRPAREGLQDSMNVLVGGQLEQLAASGGVLADLFVAPEQIAS
jgi:hypothetical protein